MASFWDRINESDVAGSLARGFDAHRKGQEAARIGWENNEWRRNRAIRDYQRQIAEDDLATNVQLGRQVNDALGIIAENRAGLYNSPTGYMSTLNALAPLQEGQSRVLSEDGKTINIVGPDGQIMDSMPNLRGKAAENALIDMSGLNLRQRASTLPQEYQFEAQLNAQNARAMLEHQYKLAMLQAGLRGGGRGLGGGMGGADGLGAGGLSQYKTSDYTGLINHMYPIFASAAGLPIASNGGPLYEAMDEAQLARSQQITSDIMRRIEYARSRGLDPVSVMADVVGGFQREQQGARNMTAAEEILAGLNRYGQSVPRKGQTAARNARLQEGFQRQAEEARANFGRTSINPFGG